METQMRLSKGKFTNQHTYSIAFFLQMTHYTWLIFLVESQGCGKTSQENGKYFLLVETSYKTEGQLLCDPAGCTKENHVCLLDPVEDLNKCG